MIKQGNTIEHAFRKGREAERELCLEMIKELEYSLKYYVSELQRTGTASVRPGKITLENLNNWRKKFLEETK